MKSISSQKLRPKLSKEVASRKQTQTRSTLNSGRSSTHNNNKRHSNQLSYQNELFKNLNKSNTLCLHLNHPTPTSISHKVIHENTHHQTKKALTKSYKLIQQPISKIPSKPPVSKNPHSKDKTKKSSVQSSDLHKFHSHRQSLAFKYNQVEASHREKSDDKENMCPNKNDDGKKPELKHSLGKLNFILEKDFKQKTNLTKKKLLLSNQHPLVKETRDQRQKQIKLKPIIQHEQNKITNSSNSIKQNKKSISSGRSHTIEKKKQTIRYISKKDYEQSHSIQPLQHSQEQKRYLRLKSPSNPVEPKEVQQDKTLSIKSLLKALIDAGDQENPRQNNIRKIIDCLTTNDNEPVEDQNSSKLSQQNPMLAQKQNLLSVKIGKPQTAKYCLSPQCQNSLGNNQLLIRMKKYEQKIAELYEELIEEKGKRYQLQEMIERYILGKELQSSRY